MNQQGEWAQVEENYWVGQEVSPESGWLDPSLTLCGTPKHCVLENKEWFV